ncbi:hypothetical protein [Microbacterium suwonense]|nr:hypothetical protein [Microbacterium suwonense]
MRENTMGNTRMRHSAASRVAAGAIGIVIAGMLTGCFANPLDDIVKKAAESSSEEAAKNIAEDLVEGLGGDELDIEFGDLPADFPDGITLVSENVMQSMSTQDGLMVVVSDPRSMTELVAQVEADFSGWEEVSRVNAGPSTILAYKKDGLPGVVVTIMDEDDGEDAVVGYTISGVE